MQLPTASSHIPALDGLRGIAILGVLFYHGTVMLGGTAIDRFVVFWAHAGWAGVDLFFVLSGFLITGILYDARGKSRYFLNFFARRFLRIFPAYYATLFALLVVLPRLPFVVDAFGPLEGGEIWYWLYLSNFALGFEYAEAPRRLDYFWSLAVEEQFYLIWPAVVLGFSRQRLMLICAGLIGFALLGRTALIIAGVHPQTIFALTPARFDSLALGALIALAARGGHLFPLLLRWAKPTVLVAAIGLLGLAFWHGGFSAFTVGMQSLGYTLFAALFGSILVLAIGMNTPNVLVRVLVQPVLRAFGRYSYAIYLFHVPLILFIEAKVFEPAQLPTLFGVALPGQILFLALTIALSFGMAWLSWHLFEKHFLALKRFFAYGAPAPQKAVRDVPGLEQPLESPPASPEIAR